MARTVFASPMQNYEGDYSGTSHVPCNIGEGGSSSDGAPHIVDQFMPYAEYNPRGRRENESDSHYEERLRQGQTTFKWRRKQLRNYLKEVARRNTEPWKLEEEMNNALAEYKRRERELRYKYPYKREDEGKSFRKPDPDRKYFDCTLSPTDSKALRSKKQSYASRFRSQYKNASTREEKEEVLHYASRHNLSLDDLTRRHFTAPQISSFAAFAETLPEQQQPEQSVEVDGPTRYQEDQLQILQGIPVYEQDAYYVPPNWLSLDIPGQGNY